MKRQGLGRGLGRGYKNIAHKDPYIHGLSAKGVKTYTKPFVSEQEGHAWDTNKTIIFDSNAYKRARRLNAYARSNLNTFVIDEEYSVVAYSEGTRNGFRHVVSLLRNGYEIDRASMNYLNRTWESFEFQSAIDKVLSKNFKGDEYQKMRELVQENRGKSYNTIFSKKMSESEARQEEKRFDAKGTTLNYMVTNPELVTGTRLEVLQSVTVPSTEYDRQIPPDKFRKRVAEVQRFLSKTFGGETTVAGQGGYVSQKGKLIQEPVQVVTSFAEKDGFDVKQDKLVNKLKDWKRRWKQESMAYQVEDDLYLV